ncbi:MAG: HAD family hydrolase [Acutalibacter sp.]
MLHTILWDWNGTLLDDVEVALAAMNEMLARRGLSLLGGREPYRDIFTFPVRVYYTAAGLDLSAEPFESLAVEWTGLYHRFYPRCGLFPAARAVLQAVGEMGLEQAIVSASHQQALDSQVEQQGALGPALENPVGDTLGQEVDFLCQFPLLGGIQLFQGKFLPSLQAPHAFPLANDRRVVYKLHAVGDAMTSFHCAISFL